MGKYDLSKTINEANEAISTSSSGSSSSSGLRLLYPYQDGKIRVKALYCVKSGKVLRKILRHQIGDSKPVCFEMFDQPCGLCEKISEIENAKGLDLWSLRVKFRAIMLAQYIDSNYTWDDENKEPEKGEVIIVMMPWTPYKDISQILVDAGENAEKVVCTNTGKVICISRKTRNNQVEYSATIDGFMDYTSCKTDEEFDKMLEELPALEDLVVSNELTQEMVNEQKELIAQLHKKYLSDMVVNPGNQPATADVSASSLPQGNPASDNGPMGTNPNPLGSGSAPTSVPAEGSDKPNGAPDCWGQEGHDENKCLMCAYQIDCLKVTKK